MDSKLLNLLVCPSCQGPLIHEAEPPRLLCHFEGIAYPIEQGVPVLLRQAGQPIHAAKASEISPNQGAEQ